MEFSVVHTENGDLSLCNLPDGSVMTTRDFLDVLANAPTQTLVLNKAALNPDFFVLKTRVAGEFLQKVSNYQRRLVVLGNFSDLSSKSLRDFVYESNKFGQVVFAANIDQAVALLK